MGRLEGKVAVVAGATRGSGRGIARMLGEAGATVYCTGRSTRGSPHPAGPYAGRPESIEDTADLVNAAGGEGIAVRVDYEVEAEVRSLFERVKRERGQLDLLINVMSGQAVTSWEPFWQLSCLEGRAFYDSWVWKHLTASAYAAGLMVEQRSGLIVEVTEGDSLALSANLYWDLVKTSLARSVYAMAEQLAEYGVSVVSVTPGYLRSEYALDYHGVTESNWREAGVKDRYFRHSETPCFIGRAVAALAADPQVNAKSGGMYSSWNLSDEYGFKDIDGGQPHWGRDIGAEIAAQATHRTNVHWQIGLSHVNGGAR
ncbi:MAG: SDR family NAD(P)-dependent oxidoreductase [Gemmatimonadota bacterium]